MPIVKPSPVEAYLAGINPDELTPKQSHEIIYQLVELLSQNDRG